MVVDFNIVLPAFLCGVIIGAALMLSRLFRVLIITSLALLLILIFYESGEGGIIKLFGRVFDYGLKNQMFTIPLLFGFVSGMILLNEINKR